MNKTTIENYQERALRTMVSLGSKAIDGAHMALGLTTEYIELEDGINKDDLPNIREEHGDILWYVANECTIYKLSFKSICKKAINSGGVFKLGDIVDLHKRELAYGKEIDANVLEELIIEAVAWLIFVAESYNFTFESSLERNIDKLIQRFPDKFTQEAALTRDLDKERKILE